LKFDPTDIDTEFDPPRRTCLRWASALAAAGSAGAPWLPAWAQGATRCALVIGNAAYPESPLRNPVSDAKAMAGKLRGLGFEVIELLDATKPRMEQGLAELGQRLAGRQGVALLFYAGHGIQLDWHNYLLAVDAAPQAAAEVPAHSLDVQQVVDVLRAAGTRINVIVLDACRDNPFGRAASQRGLAPMDAPPGTYFAYATAPGNVADDGGAAGNGLFTKHLLNEMTQVGAPIEAVFKRVRMQVRQASQGRQIPWDSSSLLDDFVFATGERLPAPARREIETAYAAERAEWDRIAASTRAEDFYAFLQRYPTGLFAELAAARLERFDRTRLVAQAERDAPVQDPAAARYRLGDEYEFTLKDGLTGLVQFRGLSRVVGLDADFVEWEGPNFAGAVTRYRATTQGASVTDALGSYDPPFVVTPVGQLQVGRRWRGRTRRTFRGGSDWLDYEGHIEARERITLPVGTLDTYRSKMQLQFGDGLFRQVTRWIDATKSITMKSVTESRRSGQPVDIRIHETVAFRPGR
jgi:uncharacterized caspase-like protein